MNRIVTTLICLVLIVGCRTHPSSVASTQLQPPIVVTGCAVADSASSLEFRDSSGRQFSLLIDYPVLHEDGVLSLSSAPRGGIGSLLQRGSPLTEQIRNALHDFVNSTATSAQIRKLKRRSQTVAELDSVTDQEWALLEAVLFIERLKQQPTTD